MAKKKDRTETKAGIKIPKHIAGVKVPKQWRKGGEALLAQASSPEGRAALVKGVSVVAGAATAAMQMGAQAATAKNQPLADTPDKPAMNPDAMGEAIGAAANAVLGRLFAQK